MTRVAAVDCGTNSLRLLVADVETATGKQVDLERRNEIVRLGQGVDRTGQLAPEALARTLTVLREYALTIDRLGAERVRMVATSATREAENRDAFVSGVVDVLGVEPEVVSGTDEAALSFTGATRGMSGVASPPHLVVDIGGGSTELVLGGSRPAGSSSVDIGCVRLTERHFHDDPPTASQVAAAHADIEAALDVAGSRVRIGDAASMIGLAGSVTTVAAIHLGLPSYEPAAIHHSRVPAARVREISDWLLTAPRGQRAAVPVMHPGRVDVIAAGALVLRCALDAAALDEVVVSEHDILDGIAWSTVVD